MPRRRSLPLRLRRLVAERDGHRCSYCRSPEVIGIPMLIDHVNPLAAGGSSTSNNLALACYRCNEFKGSHSMSHDPETGEVVPLFNPCSQSWREHFLWSRDGLTILGTTPTGRATAALLHLNDPRLIAARKLWILASLHPPVG